VNSVEEAGLFLCLDRVSSGRVGGGHRLSSRARGLGLELSKVNKGVLCGLMLCSRELARGLNTVMMLNNVMLDTVMLNTVMLIACCECCVCHVSQSVGEDNTRGNERRREPSPTCSDTCLNCHKP